MSGTNKLFSAAELIEKFTWVEYMVFGLLLLVSASIGVYFWFRGQKNNAEFLLGGD